MRMVRPTPPTLLVRLPARPLRVVRDSAGVRFEGQVFRGPDPVLALCRHLARRRRPDAPVQVWWSDGSPCCFVPSLRQLGRSGA